MLCKSVIHTNRQQLIVRYSTLRFVPKCAPVSHSDLEKANEFVRSKKRLFIITGAGLSTESGIPDYRSPEVGLYERTNHRPIQHFEFIKQAHRRQIYWARNYVSWPIFSSFKPNASHHILAKWEKRGIVEHHVTQNVDSLLVKAGCQKLTELHGSSYRVKCIDCSASFTREIIQLLIDEQNKHWRGVDRVELSADNDAILSEEQISDFKTPTCPICNRDRLKPEVVFFGDNIPKDVVEFTKCKLEKSDAVLALGTSLQVYSAYRFILYAKEKGLPIGIINIGPTRADQHADLKINATCSQVLQRIEI